MAVQSGSKKRWYLLGLAAAAHTFGSGLPYSCLPVLFGEIGKDLDLSIVQLGTAWSMLGLASATVILIGGILGDRFGIKLVLGLACIIGGLAGALRGLSVDFTSLTITVFAFGLMRGLISPNVHKVCGMWFESRNLGTANGIVALGMGFGLMIGPLISATVLSPWMGSWRYVLYFIGAISIALGVLWLLSGRMPRPINYGDGQADGVPIGKAILKLLRIKELWLIGLALALRTGGIVGLVGYLPLYLRGRGWEIASADGALAGFYAMSTLFVIPLTLLSDRTGSRKAILYVALIVSVFGFSLIPVVDGIAVWILVLAIGMFMDTYIAIALTQVQEIKGIEPRYYGVVLGLALTLAETGNFLFPLLGSRFTDINTGLPLVFWASLSFIAMIILIFTRNTVKVG